MKRGGKDGVRGIGWLGSEAGKLLIPDSERIAIGIELDHIFSPPRALSFLGINEVSKGPSHSS